MKRHINKVAVLGSGVMGSGIACHLANVGMEVLLLDIVPFDLAEEHKNSRMHRNQIVDGSLKFAIKSKPAPLYNKKFASRISTGNFDDDFEKIADCDWIIEVVVENLKIKREIFEKVEKYRKAGSLISSNTSSIPIHLLAEGRSEDFKSNFCGTHFFNPARYMKLLEIIPHVGSDQGVIDFMMDFGDHVLGKQTVKCKDTPAFIANRVGVYSGSKLFDLTEKYDLTITEVDQLTGPAIARPKTATFRLQDLVGIDTSHKVSNFILNSCPDDEYVKSVLGQEEPKFMTYLLENKFLGNKSGQGFYKKTKEKDESGKRIILALNLKTLKYEKPEKANFESLKATKKISKISERLKTLVNFDDKGGHFLNEYFAGLFAYTSNRIPEMSDDIFSVDEAMKAGYAWNLGPFEYWDMIGLQAGVEMAEKQGETVADWIKEMIENGVNSFYKIENGVRKYYDQNAKEYKVIPGTDDIINLNNLRNQAPVLQNSECTVHDIGDGVMCLEFTSKSNAIGEGIGRGVMEAIQMAEEGGWKGLVIGNNATNFSVGANLMHVGMLAMQKEFEQLREMVKGFQDVVMRLRYSNIPVVLSTQGYVFGGACEMAMHSDSAICAAESYIGLVEVGVGLLPGGCGTKEMAVRASDAFFEGDVQMPTLIDHFKPIATASVATSAYEAYDYNLLNHKDEVVVNTARNIATAKQKVLELADHYIAPIERNDVTVLGRAGLATLYTAINEFYLGKYMSEYDVEIARKVAWVMCGGDLTSPQKVSEQYLLEVEREAFLSLLGNQKTLDRIQYMLMNNKPLRN